MLVTIHPHPSVRDAHKRAKCQQAGKRNTSGLSRDQRSTEGTVHDNVPYWIRYALEEKGPLQLRSIDSKSLLVQTTLFPAHGNPFNVRGLADGGCSRWAFIGKKLVQDHKLPTQPTPYPRTLFLADGKTADIITEYIILPISIGNHNEYCLLFVTNLADDTPVIFGLPWLKRHNPHINWATTSLTFNS